MYRHGMSKSPEFMIWSSANTRCYRKAAPQYPNYGGRGIYMAEEWRTSFARFLADMGRRPPGGSLDRIDNKGPYAPGNCRWATAQEQHRNRRDSRWLTLGTVTLTASEWAERLDMLPNTLYERLRRGWSDEQALTTPCQPYDRETIASAKAHGLKPTTVKARLRRGWSRERALTAPLR